MIIRASAAVLTATLLLAACTGEPVSDAEQSPPPAEAVTPEPATDAAASPIDLRALLASDISAADLQGELACSFEGGDAVLLLAKGNAGSTEPAFGIINVGGYVERIAAPGGFDGITGGASFTGGGTAPGWTLRVALTGPAAAGGESPPRPATLTAQRADGAERVYPGEWTCGP